MSKKKGQTEETLKDPKISRGRGGWGRFLRVWRGAGSMRFIHISDLHIGKRVNEFSMLEDQSYILEQILSIVKEQQAEAVVIAGDIYDKPVPPAEAVLLFDWFLNGLTAQQAAVFVISGNHDSGERLSFGAELMRGERVYFSPVYKGRSEKIKMEDAYGEIYVHLLPFVKPATVRHALGREEISTYQQAVAAAVERMEVDESKRNVLVAHQFVTGAVRCESEEVTVGGIDQVDVGIFSKFDYVALGHIHSPQHVGRAEVRYCGTPLKYSFSEAGQKKSVTVVDFLDKGEISIRECPLTPLRDLRRIRGSYLEVTARDFCGQERRQDYLQVTLTDEEDIPDGMQKLRVFYPNLMQLAYDNQRTREDREIQEVQGVQQKSEIELLEEFYQLQNNQSMNRQQRELSQRLLEQSRERREDGGKV